MINILVNEVYKLLSRKKIYIFMVILFLLVLIMTISTVMTNKAFGTGGLGNNQTITPMQTNGQSFPVTLLDSIISFTLPIMVVILVADIVTGEYAEGSLKLPLLRQVSRKQLLLAKVGALLISIMILLFFIMILGYVFGVAILGWGDKFLLKEIILSSTYGILFTLFIYSSSIFPLLSFGMIILLFSIILSNEGSVISTGVGIFITLTIVNEMFYRVSPYLLNHYFNVYDLINSGSEIEKMITAILVIFLYGIVFYFASLISFKKKDILT
ncbi:ABC transporter permease subunit [Clostridium sp. PL3]|uniref:ABC transporter permease subunit n=1 Tax=Clostridium thailandense TaxID=2794346 RepID=A0A949TPA3_9CLOT|nr:ABC transporter permease subunit [Clostridium thailandense]MBV7276489.1 ABC transporter permease subunit [Clostridium thailandense]